MDEAAGVRARETMRFGSLRIAFDARVLRPRPWTVAQSSWAAELIGQAPAGDVLELCAGAGHIGLLAVADTDRRLVAVDADPVAADLARFNAEAAGLGERVQVRCARLDQALQAEDRFAVVIADPPWVPRARTGEFPDDPVTAIDGGDDGLEVARLCLRVIEDHLMPDGAAVLQLGTRDQAALLGAWLYERGALRLGEVREYERGVLARIDRLPTL